MDTALFSNMSSTVQGLACIQKIQAAAEEMSAHQVVQP